MTSDCLCQGAELNSPRVPIGQDLVERGSVEQVPISRLIGTMGVRSQPVDVAHVTQLSQLVDRLPPIVVHRPTMTVVDGVHRLLAIVGAGGTHVDAILIDIDLADAFVLGVQLNSAHGLPLTQRDRRLAITRILGEHPEWSDRRIAEVAGVSPKTVGAVRRTAPDLPPVTERIGRDGLPRSILANRGQPRTSAIGALDVRQPSGPVASSLHPDGAPVPPDSGTSSEPAPIAGGRMVSSRQAGQVGPGPLPDVEAGRGAGRGNGRSSEIQRTLHRLRLDPSLRDNVVGRTLLRLLSAHLWDETRLLAVADAVPSHRAADIAYAAKLCSDSWARFAQVVQSSQADGRMFPPRRRPTGDQGPEPSGR